MSTDPLVRAVLTTCPVLCDACVASTTTTTTTTTSGTTTTEPNCNNEVDPPSCNPFRYNNCLEPIAGDVIRAICPALCGTCVKSTVLTTSTTTVTTATTVTTVTATTATVTTATSTTLDYDPTVACVDN